MERRIMTELAGFTLKQVHELTSSIIKKWNEKARNGIQGAGFLRFVDGNKSNGHDINLNLIPLVLMLDHFDDWTTDWDSELTDDEIKLVKEPKWREGIVSNFNH